ncbi:MAG: alanine--tRNA ligase-related protein [Planctomycetota bacterium]
MFPQDDPTLLFINAGMNQFRTCSWAPASATTRAVDTQKCIRVQGKRNDLEGGGHLPHLLRDARQLVLW